MGYRLRVATTYKVEYSNFEYFNGLRKHINELIYKYMPDSWFDSEMLEFTETWHIPIESFKSGLEEMESVKSPLIDPELGYSNLEIIEIFNSFYSQYDDNNDYIVLSWM